MARAACMAHTQLRLGCLGETRHREQGNKALSNEWQEQLAWHTLRYALVALGKQGTGNTGTRH
eukprot:1156744-Pelagomonas_calceolata.AAC.4